MQTSISINCSKVLANVDESREGFCSKTASASPQQLLYGPHSCFSDCLLSAVVWDEVRVLVALNQVAVAGLVLSVEGLHRSGCDIVGSRLKCQQRSAR